MLVIPAKAGTPFFLKMDPRLRGGDIYWFLTTLPFSIFTT